MRGQTSAPTSAPHENGKGTTPENAKEKGRGKGGCKDQMGLRTIPGMGMPRGRYATNDGLADYNHSEATSNHTVPTGGRHESYIHGTHVAAAPNNDIHRDVSRRSQEPRGRGNKTSYSRGNETRTQQTHPEIPSRAQIQHSVEWPQHRTAPPQG